MFKSIVRRKNHVADYGPIGESVARRSYLKPKNLSYIHKTNSDVMEKWEDLCYRVAQGNINFLSRNIEEKEAQELYDSLVDMKILLGGRHFCNTGIKGREFVGNCFVSGWNWLRIGFHFSFTFERLMEGGGVGANYSDRYFKDSPRIRPVKVMYSCSTKHKDYNNLRSMLTRKKQKGVKTFVIPDSREGWTKALDMLITAFGGGYPYLLNFDFSEIRPQGSKLKRTGGAASGPEPLLKTFKTISDLLMDNVGKKFDWEMGMIIDQAIAECVMAGGCRRSARMAVKHWKDEDILEFINIKKGGTEHWTTNISVIVDNEFMSAIEAKDERALTVFEAVIDGMFVNGEPGFAFYDNAIKGENRFYSPNACFSGNEKILTHEGYVSFLELKKLQDDQVPFRLLDDRGFFEEGRVIPAGVKDVVTLFSRGREVLTCTPDHQIMTEEGKLEKAKDLKGKSVRLNRKFVNPVEEDYFALGFIQGDGNTGRLSSEVHKGLEINIGDKDLDIAEMLDILPELKNRKAYTRKYYELCKEVGMSHNRLPERELPSNFYSFSRRQKIDFLSGLFSANGSVLTKAKRISLKGTNLNMLCSVKNVLLTEFDIQSYITTNKAKKQKFRNGVYEMKESYDLNIAKFLDVVKFKDTFFFGQRHKRQNLLQIIDETPLSITKIVDVGFSEVFDFTINSENHLGFVNGVNSLNCGEFYMEEGEFCNTGHINLARIGSNEEATKIGKLTTRALMRANYCDLPSESREITDKNQRIGVGIMGLQNFSLNRGVKYSDIPQDPKMEEFFKGLYGTVRQTADEYAEELGINKPIKVTTVAPTGSVGQVAGATTGCQSIIYKYYIRRMRLHIDDPQVMEYKSKGYKIEVDANAPETGVIVCIPMKDPLLDEFAEELIEDQADVGAEKALKLQEFLQEHWADNSISFTINFDPREVNKEELGEQILNSLPKLKGTTVLPELHNYAQPPYTRITKEEYLTEIAKIQDKESSETIEVQCAGGSCEIII